MTIRSRMSSIMGVIGPEQDFVYTVASTNINQLVLNLVKVYMTLTAWIISIMGVIRPEELELFALELENSLELFLVRSITLSSPV